MLDPYSVHSFTHEGLSLAVNLTGAQNKKNKKVYVSLHFSHSSSLVLFSFFKATFKKIYVLPEGGSTNNFSLPLIFKIT